MGKNVGKFGGGVIFLTHTVVCRLKSAGYFSRVSNNVTLRRVTSGVIRRPIGKWQLIDMSQLPPALGGHLYTDYTDTKYGLLLDQRTHAYHHPSQPHWAFQFDVITLQRI